MTLEDILCETIDTIVTSKIQGLQYDITKLCTIEDDSSSSEGKYIVSDGAIKFEAYSDITNYREGNQVLVTIPNGDFNMQKTIIGRKTADDTAPFVYTAPLDTMIQIEDNNQIVSGSFGLLANEDNTSKVIGPIYTITDINNFQGFTRMGISADFKTWLTGYDAAEGMYGLRMYIYTKSSNLDEKDNIYEMTFSNEDMYGNPYQFENYFSQEKVFDISTLNAINKIEVYFYQNGSFKNGDGELIPWQDDFGNKMPNNIYVDNIKFCFGYESNYFEDETLILLTNEVLEYSYADEVNTKTVNLRWIHKINDNSYKVLKEEDFKDGKFKVKWYRYYYDVNKVDGYAGLGWEEIEPVSNLTLTFEPNIANQSEELKVIGFIAGSEDTEGTAYFSNIIKFTNKEAVPDQPTLEAATALTIYCEDGSEGNYFIYNQNGKILNEGNGQGYLRKLRAMYKGASLEESDLGGIDYVSWWLPENSTMLMHNEELYEGATVNKHLNYKGVNYTEIIYYPKDNNIPKTTQDYSINNYWTQSKTNNTVRCIVSINGIVHESLEEMQFGKAGTNGSNLTMVLDFAGNKNAIVLGEDVIVAEAHLYDQEGKQLEFGTAQITWGWFKESGHMQIEPNGTTATITSNYTVLPEDNYHILEASCEVSGLKINAYLPIPIKVAECSHIEGAREVIYNHMGTPNYYSDAYIAYKYINGAYEKALDAIWEINYDESLIDGMGQAYLPKLKDITIGKDKYKGLLASLFYAFGYNDKVCVSCQYWSQPILIMQSQYDFAMLNNWQGGLELDEEKGTILSAMLGAGRKNEDNTFSGVLIGDVQQGTDLETSPPQTGVYGLHKGVISYQLREDGTATFGKDGRGQIIMNGNEGTITSSNFNNNGTGMKIDLDDGIIDIIKALNGARISIKPTDPYMLVISPNNNEILHLGSNQLFLQSDNQSIVNGSRLDLNNGNLDIRSPYGKVIISGGYAGGQATPYFSIAVPTSETTSSGDYSNQLFYLDGDEYYLKSKDYIETEFIKIEGYDTYRDTQGNIVAVSNDASLTVYTTNGTSITGTKTFQAVTEKQEQEDGSVITVVVQTAEQVKQNYLASLIPNLRSVQATRGFKLDLKNSSIQGYDLYLKGTKASTNQSFILDSSAPTTPFRVGSDFNVNWDGTLTCNKVNSLNDDDRNDKAISINNNFYVNKNGSMGSGSGSFGSLYAGGYNVGSSIGGFNSSISKLQSDLAQLRSEYNEARQLLSQQIEATAAFRTTFNNHTHQVAAHNHGAGSIAVGGQAATGSTSARGSYTSDYQGNF